MPALDGKTAIVTGASSGIGAAIARALADEGVRVAGGARRVDRVETEIALELDVTDPPSCERFVEQAVEQLGGLDVLVNNAGLALGRDPFWESSEDDESAVLQTNVAGLYVQSAVVDVANARFTVTLSKGVDATTRIAYMVLN